MEKRHLKSLRKILFILGWQILFGPIKKKNSLIYSLHQANKKIEM